MTDLGTPGGPRASASGINASGQVTGFVAVPQTPDCGSSDGHAFLYSNGKMQDLGTLDGGCSSGGVAINDAGQIAGESSLNGFQEQHAFLWSNGVMQDLGTLGGYAYVFGMNSKGQVVGDSMAPDGQNHAFLYTDGKMYDLNDLVTGLAGTLLSIATGINDNGQIVADGCSMSLVCQAFRLDPVVPRSGPPAKVATIEYYYPAFDHYFMTAFPEEIAALDGGAFPGWVRTGEGFNVYSDPSIDSAVMCRFFSTAFGPKSSHFFTADPGECSMVKLSGDWQLEGDVMPIPVPDGAGNCAAGTQPVYRLYNNGQGGAPAHRYTTSLSVRSQMLAQGWISEGYGDNGVIMCAPI
jgi:probable HAF family extracellular repeat protein